MSDPVLENAVLLDVRSLGEWNGGHIEGAIHCPVGEINKIETLIPDKAKNVNVYCLAGGRAEHAKQVMLGMGYQHVSNLGGFEEAKSKLGK